MFWVSEYLGNLQYVLYLHLHILTFIYSTISLVNLARYLEPWADIQVSAISLVNLASYLEPWADIQVSTISLVILASYLEPWADIQVSGLIMRQPTSFECISLCFRIIPTQSVMATGPVFRNIVVLLHTFKTKYTRPKSLCNGACFFKYLTHSFRKLNIQ